MTKLARILGVVMLLVLVTASPALAARKQPDLQVPIRGTVTGETGVDPAAPDCEGGALWRFFSSGAGTISHLGRVDYHLTQCSYPSPEGTVFRGGTVAFTAANGDTLIIAQEGSSEIIGAFDGYTLDATWTVVGGSGRFAGATGSGTLDGVGDIPSDDTLFGLPEGGVRIGFAGGIAYDASARAR